MSNQPSKKQAGRNRSSALARMPLTAAIYLALSAGALAQEAPATDATAKSEEAVTLGTVTVTAQRRVENLQKVPISLQVLGAEKLDQMQVSDFDDYAKLIPSLSYGTAGGGVFSGPGFVQVYMRGVASGGDGNHSGSQPSVGMYLDEQPITTIQGSLDIHMYDIERVEALAGPQGTLFGASSQAGTVRLITKKPDTLGFQSSYSVETSAIEGGGLGHVLEAMVNNPINDKAALRVVAWEKHDAGYVDNKFGTRTFPTSGITVDNSDFAEKNYNDADTYGARAALKIDLNDNWTITPTIMGQHQKAHGSTGYDPQVGDLAVTHFRPESSNDKWTQAALTVEGKVGNFDITYAFSQLNRDVDSEADYSDYAFWYDTLAGYGAYFYDNSGDLIDPTQYIQAKDAYLKTSHELRIATPSENRIRFVGGVFWQEQKHDIEQRYRVDNLADSLEVPGWSDTIWLTQQDRKDRDKAIFGQASVDVTDKLTVTGGLRFFKNNNGLKGFFGYGAGFSGSTGEAACVSATPYEGAPCLSLDKKTHESDHIGRVNATYQFTDDKMVYVTWSEGYRPGGINRRGDTNYTSDFLTNYEAGWKTSWADNTLKFNGAVFRENWDDFQFSFLGANGLTEIQNAAQGKIDGVEVELDWAASYNLSISGGMAYYDATLDANYCGWLIPGTSQSETVCPAGTINPVNGNVVDGPAASKGSRLPITPKFKGNLTARYTFDYRDGEAFWQTSMVHVGNRRTDLRDAENSLLGNLDAYTTFDLSAGYRKNSWALEFYLKNATDKRPDLARFSECAASTCGFQPYTVTAQPRTLGVKFSQDF